MTTSTSSAAVASLCQRCGLDPCACAYIAKLRPGAELGHLRDAALLNFGKPLPHLDAVRDGDDARGPFGLSCPCPKCYSLRMAGWPVELGAS